MCRKYLYFLKTTLKALQHITTTVNPLTFAKLHLYSPINSVQPTTPTLLISRRLIWPLIVPTTNSTPRPLVEAADHRLGRFFEHQSYCMLVLVLSSPIKPQKVCVFPPEVPLAPPQPTTTPFHPNAQQVSYDHFSPSLRAFATFVLSILFLTMFGRPYLLRSGGQLWMSVGSSHNRTWELVAQGESSQVCSLCKAVRIY